MAGPFGLGDPNACERAAADCERAARQLDGSIQRLTTLRGTAADAWRGTAGTSLVGTVDTSRQGLVQAQTELHEAAARLRAAASEIREAIRQAERREAERRERERRQSQASMRLPTLPMGPAA
jgi:uncharacterized protein YukE